MESMTHSRVKSNFQFLCWFRSLYWYIKHWVSAIVRSLTLYCSSLYWHSLPPNPWSSHFLSPFPCSLLKFFFLNVSYPFSNNTLFLSYYCSLSSRQDSLVFKNQTLGINLSGLKFRLYHFLNMASQVMQW